MNSCYLMLYSYSFLWKFDLAHANWASHIGEVLRVNYHFWPIFNFLNFRFVPPKFRALAVTIAGLFFNAFLVHTNRKPKYKPTVLN